MATAAVSRISSPSYAVPPSQHTAPVIEYNCLFTRDLRRKHKRWQDGTLKYHTFNRRITVYDDSRSYIGDVHYASGQHLQEGDELDLDKGGISVTVADLIARTETDVSELVEQRKPKPLRQQSGAGQSRNLQRTPAAQRLPLPSTTVPHKHRSLQTMLNTPGKLIGRVHASAQSPFEQRYAISPINSPTNVKTKTSIARGVSKHLSIDGTRPHTAPPKHAVEAPSTRSPPSSILENAGQTGTLIDLTHHNDDSTPRSRVATAFSPKSNRNMPSAPKVIESVSHKHGQELYRQSLDSAKTSKRHEQVHTTPQLAEASHRVAEDGVTDQGSRLMLASRAPRRMITASRQLGAKTLPDNPYGDDDTAAQARIAERRRRAKARLKAIDAANNDADPDCAGTMRADRLANQQAINQEMISDKRQERRLHPNATDTQPKTLLADVEESARKVTLSSEAPIQIDVPTIDLIRSASKRKDVPVSANAISRGAPQQPSRPASKYTKQNTGVRKQTKSTHDICAASASVQGTMAAKPFRAVAGPQATEAQDITIAKERAAADQGPWSREAFDLFDWQPPAAKA